MYGMDKDADGVVDFAEIQAYEKYKKELLAKANSAEEARLAEKAAREAVRVAPPLLPTSRAHVPCCLVYDDGLQADVCVRARAYVRTCFIRLFIARRRRMRRARPPRWACTATSMVTTWLPSSMRRR